MTLPLVLLSCSCRTLDHRVTVPAGCRVTAWLLWSCLCGVSISCSIGRLASDSRCCRTPRLPRSQELSESKQWPSESAETRPRFTMWHSSELRIPSTLTRVVTTSRTPTFKAPSISSSATGNRTSRSVHLARQLASSSTVIAGEVSRFGCSCWAEDCAAYVCCGWMDVQDSHLHSIADSFGSLTAQKRNESDMNTGFSFVNCKIDGTGIIYLGRAWGNYSRVVYSWSYLNDMIIPEGWQDWGIPARQG